jgi:hypothetical protein
MRIKTPMTKALFLYLFTIFTPPPLTVRYTLSGSPAMSVHADGNFVCLERASKRFSGCGLTVAA